MASLNRRRFLKASALAMAAPYIVPSTCFGANERMTVGMIGVGRQGAGNLNRMLGMGCNVAAVSDVDANHRNRAAEIVEKANGSKPQLENDYRKLLERKDIDAVVITTPDHWHALQTIHACQAGKDVYCEKPLSLTIQDGRRMVQAARDNKRIVQTGSQQRSGKEFWTAVSLVRNGKIGKIEKVLAGIALPNHPGPVGPDTDPPAELDYELWLGPAAYRPYAEKRVHYNFRFWWDYSGGQMTNWGAHHIDIAQWGLGMDDSGPVSSEGTATFHPELVHDVTESCRITHRYANGVELIVGQAQADIPAGTTFIGDQGQIFVTRGKLVMTPEELNTEVIEDLPIQIARSTDHYQNFFDCIKSRELPVCDVEIGHRSATVCHLGNLVARLGRGVQWNPETEQAVEDNEAQQMTDREYRSPWKHDTKFAAL